MDAENYDFVKWTTRSIARSTWPQSCGPVSKGKDAINNYWFTGQLYWQLGRMQVRSYHWRLFRHPVLTAGGDNTRVFSFTSSMTSSIMLSSVPPISFKYSKGYTMVQAT